MVNIETVMVTFDVENEDKPGKTLSEPRRGSTDAKP